METPEKTDEATLPLLTPKNAGGSQRVIKQIMVIDPNKLRLAGLDVKMAEALKKAKRKSQPKSKESKLAAAKSILNKKLKEAISLKNAAKISPPTPSKSVKSIEEAVKNLSSAHKNKANKSKAKISVATLKSLMPPPSFPVSSLISPNQTVEIKVLKSENTKQSIEVKIVDSSAETPPKIDKFPKASLITPKIIKTVKTQAITPDIKFEVSKKSSLAENLDEPKVIIVHVEGKDKIEKPSKGSPKKEYTSGPVVHNKPLTTEDEPPKNKSLKTVNFDSPPCEDKSSNEKIIPLETQEKSLVTETEPSINLASLTPIHAESPDTSESSLEIIDIFKPIRRESLPKVIESKVLLPSEKIDLSILTKKTPGALTVPKKRYKLDQNWISSEANRAESVYLNLAQVPKPSPPKASSAQESAVDFINNLSLFFAESQKNKSKTKNVPESLTQECGEDATSFLVSLFQKKQHAPPKVQPVPIKKINEALNTAAVKEKCETTEVQLEQNMSEQDANSKTSLNTTNTQVPQLDTNNSSQNKNKTNEDHQLIAENVHEEELDASQSTQQLSSDKESIHDNICMTSNTETEANTIEPIEHPTDLNKTGTNTQEVDTAQSNLSVSMTSQIPSETELLQELVPKLLTPPKSCRRKVNKPIPVLIPKLKKSRKPTTPVQKPPEEAIPLKSTQKPDEESPTQPVETKEAFINHVPIDPTPCETDEIKEYLPDKSSQAPPEKPEQDSSESNEESQASTISSLSTKDSAQILDELPTTSKTAERPQRQRKISTKWVESSEILPTIKSPFQGVVDRTVELMIKENKEPSTSKERPQRQRKVSFQLLESSEFLPTTVTPHIPEMLDTSNEQEFKVKAVLPTTTDRPQRQRRMTLKLLESSEALSTMKSLVPSKNRSVECNINEKNQLPTATKQSQSTEDKTENTNLDSLFAIGIDNEKLKDPIAQLVAFHETVEKFELACGSTKSKKTQNTNTNLDVRDKLLSDYPFYDAICSAMSGSHIPSNQPTESKPNPSNEQIPTKNLRKRKDSLKSRTFVGDQISIISSDSLEISKHNAKTKKNMHRSHSEVVPESFEPTPNLAETNFHDQNLISELIKNEEILHNTAVLNATAVSSTPPQSDRNETHSAKRRGRPPKVKKQIRKLAVTAAPVSTEFSQQTTSSISNQPSTNVMSKNDNLDASFEKLPLPDDHHNQEVKQGLVVEIPTEVFPPTTSESCNKPNTTVTDATPDKKDKVEEVPEIHSDIEDKTYKTENIIVNADDDKKIDEVINIEGNETPKLTRKKGRPPKVSKHPRNLNQHQIEIEVPASSLESDVVTDDEINKLGRLSKSALEITNEIENAKECDILKKVVPQKVSKVSESLILETTNRTPTDSIEITHEDEKLSTSKPMKIVDKLPECKKGEYKTEPGQIDVVNVTKNSAGAHTSSTSAQTIKTSETVSDEVQQNSEKNHESKKEHQQLSKPSNDIEASGSDKSPTNKDYLANKREDHPRLTKTAKATETKQESTTPSDLFDSLKLQERSIGIEASNTAHTDEPQISGLKSPKSPSKANESSESEQNNPNKNVPHFEDLMFDLDHIESPSFSPICESSRISNDSDGFEEIDEDLTSALINTVTEAENFADKSLSPEGKSLDKSCNSSVAGETFENESKSTSLGDTQSKNIKQSLSKSSENTKPVELSKSSIDICKNTSEHDKEIPSTSSIIAKNFPEDAKHLKQTKFDEVSLAENPSIVVAKSTSLGESILKSSENTKPVELSKSSIDLCKNTSEHDKEIPSTSSSIIAKNFPEDAKHLKQTKFDEVSLAENPPVVVAKSTSLGESILKSSENTKSVELSKSSINLCRNTSEHNKESPSTSSIIAKKFPEDPKQLKHTKSDLVSFAVNPPIVVPKSDKDKDIPDSKCPEKLKSLGKLNSETINQSTDHTNESPNDLKSTEELTAAKIKQTSALHCAVLSNSEQNKKEPRKEIAKNPFKKQIPKENTKKSINMSPIGFLGFNEKEIEEGQQSTSLKLSQSDDPESYPIETPLTSYIKPKQKIKESQAISGKGQKQEKQKWEKCSAKSLKNWLSNPVKSVSTDDVCDFREDSKEQSSAVPLKKRRNKVENLTEPIPPEKNVKILEEEISDANKSETEVNVSVIDESRDSSNKNEKRKRGRKPKLKNIPKEEENILRDDLKRSSKKHLSKSSEPLLVDDDGDEFKTHRRGTKSKVTADDVDEFKTPRRGTKYKVAADDVDEFKTPRRGTKSKVAADDVDEFETPRRGTKSKVAADDCEKELPATPMTGKANNRKRSMPEESTPTSTEPPTKVANLGQDILSCDLFKPMRKQGRPRKSTDNQHSIVTTSPVVQNSPIQKKYKDDYEFNPRLLLIRNKEELKNNEPLVDPNLQTEPLGLDDLQCALCMGYAPKKKWIQHLSSHYGIGWVVGKTPPVNINSRGSILSYLIEFFKVSKVKGLNCRLCNSLRRSGLGLLMHLEQCCLTKEEIRGTKVVCEYCKKKYSKSSYLVHKRTCTDYLKLVLEEAKAEVPEDTRSGDAISNTGRLKRKAVIMAETKLKKLDEEPEFVPDDLIKYIPNENIRSIESIKENWLMELNAFGKGFCASKTCRFTATSIDDLIDHYHDNVCPYFLKAGYFCARCKFYNQNIEMVRAHVVDKHSPKPPRSKDDRDVETDSSDSSDSISSGDDEGESESVDENGEKKPKRIKKPKSKPRRRPFQSRHPPTKDYKKLLPERRSNIQQVVVRFYDKFIDTNYSLDPLFTFAKTNPIHIETSESYFPKMADSIRFIHNGFHGFVKTLGATKVEPDKWKQLERLHALTENSEYTIFMGGPVRNIAWVPLDPHPPSNTQYLAVTVRKGLDKFTRFLNQKRSRSLIFIFKFDISLPSELKGEIIYAVAIDEGPIHAIEFLPSGGYSPEMNRLGMLAVGTIETEIKIYSLPIKVEKLDCDLFPIVRLAASIELNLELLDNPSDKTDIYNSQCSCLEWSQTAGHSIIVASFVNGFVGIWDICDDPGNLNRFDKNESKMFTPASYFWTSEDRLMNLALHYDMNGPRWLAVSNSTRKMLLYDLRDITQPMLLHTEVTINIINCIEWPVVWENIMFGIGSAMPSNGCAISVFSPMSIMFATRRFEKFCSGVTDMHYNIWRNCFVAGSENGDVQVTALREGVLDVAQRLKIDEKTILTLDIVSLNGEKICENGIQIPSDGMRVFDKDYKDQYGIVFGSLRKIKGCNKRDYYNAERVPPLNLHRLMRVSKLRFNQNKNACDLLAIGYESGLLRVRMHDWLKKD